MIDQYASTLREGGSRMIPKLSEFLQSADELSATVGQIDLTFGHNDLLPVNFIDDGSRLWLIDWDYAGVNSVLFDLGGLASNNSFSEEQEVLMLEEFYEQSVDGELWQKYQAMKCAWLLRESIWSMVSEIHSTIDFDFVGYTKENLGRFHESFEKYRNEFG